MAKEGKSYHLKFQLLQKIHIFLFRENDLHTCDDVNT